MQILGLALEAPKKNDTSVAQAASDIRRYVAALPDGQRMDFLHAAVNHGDHEVVAAVLGTSGFVSGLNREQAATIRDTASKQFAPRQYDQLAALNSVADTLTTAAKIWSMRFDQLLPRVVESSHEKALKALKAGA